MQDAAVEVGEDAAGEAGQGVREGDREGGVEVWALPGECRVREGVQGEDQVAWCSVGCLVCFAGEGDAGV